MREGYKQTDKGEFPSEWKEKEWQDVCEICYGKDQKEVIDHHGQYPIYGTGGCMGTANKFLYDKPSVLIGRKGTIDKPFFCDHPFWTVDTLFYTRISEDIDPKWFYYIVDSTPLKIYNEATGVPSLSRSNLYRIKLAVPPLLEQQKIAEILSTVEEKIEVIREQITQTQELKKGLMQLLLTKGIGHSRFKSSPIGEIPDCWIIRKVGDVAKLQGGFAFKSSDNQVFGLKWLKIANVSLGKIDWSDKSFLPISFSERYKDFLLKEGDIVIAMTRPILGNDLKIAKIEKNDAGCLLNQRVGRIIESDKVDKEFIYQTFNSPDFINKLKKELLGSDPPNISSSMFEELNILVPPIPEQVKIGKIFSTVDEKLKVLKDKKNHYQELKNGLMQQLLTGKIRVNHLVEQPELA